MCVEPRGVAGQDGRCTNHAEPAAGLHDYQQTGPAAPTRGSDLRLDSALEFLRQRVFLRFHIAPPLTSSSSGQPIENLNGLFSIRYAKIKNVTF
jgi:hypothetical protein